MVAAFLIVLLVLAVAYLTYWLAGGLRLYLKLRGKRLVTCPETNRPSAVEVAAGSVAIDSLIGPFNLRLRECSRWPARQNCGQACLAQIEAAPEDCLVWTIISKWYQGQECAYCHRRFGHINWHDHRPALVNSNRRTVQWDKVPVEKLPEILKTHRPVCWDCHIAETFRREHPDLVVDRSWKH
jgi:hypothetical protein